MTSVAVLLVSSALGVHWGWQPIAGGGYEYIIRIEPHLLDSLKEGHAISSDLPPELRDVRAYQIIVDDKPVPHEDQAPPVAAKSSRPEVPDIAAPAPASGAPQLFDPPGVAATATPEAAGNPASDPMVKQAGGPLAAMNQAATNQTSEPPTTALKAAIDAKQADDAKSKPWGVLATVALGLFASIGLNVFLGWVNRDLRVRYRGLLAELRPSQAAPA